MRQDRARRLKIRIFHLLGGKCNNCGNNNYFHLQLEHIHNNGAERRENYKKSELMIAAYLNDNLPIEEVQLLCANCNIEKQLRTYPKITQVIEEHSPHMQ